MARFDYYPKYPSQEQLNEMIQGWKDDPLHMRTLIIAQGGVASPLQTLVAMSMATQEEACFEALMRHETSIVKSEDKVPCDTCHQLMIKLANGMAVYKPIMTCNTAIWMGPTRRWVCSVCMTPQPAIPDTPTTEQVHSGSGRA